MRQRITSIFLAMFLFLFGVSPIMAANADESDVSSKTALKAAIFHVLNEVKGDPHSGWRGGKISFSKPQEVFDTSGKNVEFLINIKVANKAAGFITIGSSTEDYPVISYSYEGSALNNEQKSTLIQTLNSKPHKERLISAGPGRIALEIEFGDGKKVIKNPKGQEVDIPLGQTTKLKTKTKKELEDTKKLWKEIDFTTNEIGSDSDGVTDVDPSTWEAGYSSVNRNYINGVPDIDQWFYSGNNWTGCSPTAASNIVAYYSNNFNAYRSLVPNTQRDAVMELRTLMKTQQNSNGEGSTLVALIPDGLKQYAVNHGFPNAISYNSGNIPTYTSVAYPTYKIEIDRGRPALLDFIGQAHYVNHTVTGVGYKEYVYNGSSSGHQYLVVHDNWSNTAQTVYIAYGRNYSTVIMTAFQL